MRVGFLQGPHLNNNVNTNNGYSGFGQILMNDARHGLDLNERKRQTNLNEKYRRDALSQNQVNSDRTFDLNKDKFDWEKDKYQDRVNANAELVKTQYPEISKKIAFQYGAYPSIENEKSFRNVLGNININSIKSRNKSFKTFEGMGENGTPFIYTLDNNGNIKNTQITPYIKPKQSSSEREAYYQAKNEDLKQKRLDNMVKSIDIKYPNMSEDERLKAINYINNNGVMPIIKNDNGWFGKGYYIEMDQQEKAKKKKQLEEDMKLLGL